MPKPSDDDIMVLIESNLNENDKRHILVTHDESVFYANDGKKTFWRPIGYQSLHKKGAGLSLHISDFLTEVDDQLKFEQEEACITMKPVVNSIPIFEKLHSVEIDVFAFNNAISYAAYAEDALIASKMNLKPGSKGKFKNGLMPDGSIQSMHLPNEQPKGIRLVLKE
ncbi:hypothetical protein C1645_758920 [Glomus cerebriforme]|uniref:Uncharacterized protein n=1 Tax=Glomus cerebriforme TaxID=658196 RepID=A0A397TBW8_9GLOM|nr:hypothetical protein C1645_758920 [Glomus cerebriforme]